MGTSYIYEDNLESERLITRKLNDNDIAPWAAFFADKEAVEFLPNFGFTSNLECAKHMIEKQLLRYTDKRFGLQALIEKKTGNFIGVCGLLAQEVDGKTETEVGYHILKKYCGQGFAPEAAKLFIEYAFQNKLTPYVISVIDVKNSKSQRVAEKNGLTIERQTKWLDDEDVYIYRIDKEKWK